jgi:hypothetical protein
MLPRVQESGREWTSTLQVNSHFGSWNPDELPNLKKTIAWVKSHWIKTFFISLEISWKLDVQNGLPWPIWTLKTQVMDKEGLGIKLTIWFPTIKSQESTRFICMQVACNIPLESSWQGLQLCFKLHLNWRSVNKVMGPQSCGTPNFGNFRTPTWEPWNKMPFRCWCRG